MPPLAASVVRTFARTETFIPMYPASPEKNAPTRNPKAIVHPSFGTSPIIKKSTTAIIPIVLYCLFK